jgi:hypothetical protein
LALAITFKKEHFVVNISVVAVVAIVVVAN